MYVQCGQTIRSTGDSLPEPRRGATGSGFCIEAPFAEETAGKQRACFPPDEDAAAARCDERLMGYFCRRVLGASPRRSVPEPFTVRALVSADGPPVSSGTPSLRICSAGGWARGAA